MTVDFIWLCSSRTPAVTAPEPAATIGPKKGNSQVVFILCSLMSWVQILYQSFQLSRILSPTERISVQCRWNGGLPTCGMQEEWRSKKLLQHPATIGPMQARPSSDPKRAHKHKQSS